MRVRRKYKFIIFVVIIIIIASMIPVLRRIIYYDRGAWCVLRVPIFMYYILYYVRNVHIFTTVLEFLLHCIAGSRGVIFLHNILKC